jgi:hypothetical protein
LGVFPRRVPWGFSAPWKHNELPLQRGLLAGFIKGGRKSHKGLSPAGAGF